MPLNYTKAKVTVPGCAPGERMQTWTATFTAGAPSKPTTTPSNCRRNPSNDHTRSHRHLLCLLMRFCEPRLEGLPRKTQELTAPQITDKRCKVTTTMIAIGDRYSQPGGEICVHGLISSATGILVTYSTKLYDESVIHTIHLNDFQQLLQQTNAQRL